MTSALELTDVSVTRDGRRVLGPLDWTVEAHERWAVLGRNGCGKSTLFRVASMSQHPSTGSVTVLGQTLGRTDVRKLRPAIGYASAGLADAFRPTITVRDVVMTAKFGALEAWWHTYDDADRARAVELLERFEIGSMADRAFSSLSSGERQRVLLARTLMTDPSLVLLDEPTAALDVTGREELVADLDRLARDHDAPALALVTHHVEEIPASFTHALLITDGEALAQGPIDEVVTAQNLTKTFGLPLRLDRRDGRWFAFRDHGKDHAS